MYVSLALSCHSVTLDRFRKLHLDEVRIGRSLPSDSLACLMPNAIFLAPVRHLDFFALTFMPVQQKLSSSAVRTHLAFIWVVVVFVVVIVRSSIKLLIGA